MASAGAVAGLVTLASGVATISNSLITTASVAVVQQQSPVGTLGAQYKAVCTAGLLTITAITAALGTQVLDTSTLQYILVF